MTEKEKLLKIRDLVNVVDEPKEFDDVYSVCGGNFDDAYSLGYDNGVAEMAESIRNILNDKVEKQS